MWRVFGGAALVIAGIAAFIEAHSHKPGPAVTPEPGVIYAPNVTFHGPTGLSHNTYDLLRIGAWALVIVGALLIVVGLIGYWGAQRRTPGQTG